MFQRQNKHVKFVYLNAIEFVRHPLKLAADP